MKSPRTIIERSPYYRVARTLMADRRHNRALDRSASHVLIIRDLYVMDRYNDHFLEWCRERRPDGARHLRLGRLGRLPTNLRGTALLAPWLQDPLRERDPGCYARAMRLQQRCRARDIPIAGPVEALSSSIKSRALELIRDTGIRAARVVPIGDPAAFDPGALGLEFPFVVREDRRHGGPMLRILNGDDLARVPWRELRHPVALEYIETRSPDGLYRKYRYVLMGEVGVPRHLVISDDWCVHAEKRLNDAAIRREELDYVQVERDPNHARLDRARRALGLDVVAFDYSYDPDGELVVWEPNPFPTFWSAYNRTTDCGYQQPVMERLYGELLNYYLRRAGIAVPQTPRS